METLKGTLPGLIIVLLITAVSIFLSLLHPTFDSLAVSIIFGMFIAVFIKDRIMLDKGIEFAIKVFLPLGIALYGTQLSFAGGDINIWLGVTGIVIALFLLTYFISKKMQLSRNITILLSTGISICGASAIVVISPLIKAKKEETSISIISVMALGLAGVIFYPIISDHLILNSEEFAFLTGTTLPMLGQVKITAATAGPETLALALKLKLIRISTLIIIPILAIILSGERKKLYIPWFIAVFIALAISVNITEKAGSLIKIAAPISKFFLTSTLAAIGLSVNLDTIAEKGIRPFLAAFLSSSIIILVIYI